MEDPIIEEIAEDVHRGWMEEKQRQGFADHVWPTNPEMIAVSLIGVDGRGRPHHAKTCVQYACLQLQDKHHPDMLPYEDLAENVKEYDRATARAVFSGLKHRGYLVLHPVRVKQIQALLGSQGASL